MNTTRSSARRSRIAARAAWLAGLITAIALAPAGQASAHTDFDFSIPEDGEVVDQPVADITIAFTNPATPAGAGFEVLGPTGSFITPTSIDETDGTSFVLTFDPPLTGGAHGVRWEVRAGDAHPINGAFSFTVAAAPTPTSTPPTTPTTPTTTAATSLDTATPSTIAPPTTAATQLGTTATPATDPPTTSDEPATTLEEFLAGDGEDDGTGKAAGVGRFLSISGLMVALGAVIALVWVIEGRRDEIRDVLAWIRLAGLGIATGGVIEFAALQTAQQTELLDMAGTKPGVAALLKVAGGLVVFFGIRSDVGQIRPAGRSLSAAALTAESGLLAGKANEPSARWRPTASAGPMFAGLVAVLVSFWFDGHTVTKGHWIVHSFTNSVHLVAAAAWAGGVIVLAALLARRHRAGVAPGAATLIVRFSGVATIALIAVALAGALMAFFVLDSPSDLTSSDWGRALLIKNAAVAVAAALGAYNHFRLRPALEADPESEQLSTEFRRTLYVEAAVFAIVIATTAWLVAAGT